MGLFDRLLPPGSKEAIQQALAPSSGIDTVDSTSNQDIARFTNYRSPPGGGGPAPQWTLIMPASTARRAGSISYGLSYINTPTAFVTINLFYVTLTDHQPSAGFFEGPCGIALQAGDLFELPFVKASKDEMRVYNGNVWGRYDFNDGAIINMVTVTEVGPF